MQLRLELVLEADLLLTAALGAMSVRLTAGARLVGVHALLLEQACGFMDRLACRFIVLRLWHEEGVVEGERE